MSQDTSLKTLVVELAEVIRSGQCVHGQKRRSVRGHIYIFRVDNPAPTGAQSGAQSDRFERALAWMRETQVTNRAAFFRDCPDAGGSASLHNRLIRTLVKSGEIERIGREYVFKD